MKAHFFIDESGVLRVITDMPEEPIKSFDACHYVSALHEYNYAMEEYQSALKAAKDQALEVVNKDEVEDILWDKHSPTHGWDFKEGEIYSLECEMTLKYQVKSLFDGWNDCTEYIYTGYLLPKRQVALITFSEPKPMNEEKEVPIVWTQCLNCEARNHPQNTKCDECGSSSLENENLVKKSIPPLPVEDKEEQKKLWKLALHHAGSRMDFMKFLTDRFIIKPRKQLE
jgi:ribosomal protein L40E